MPTSPRCGRLNGRSALITGVTGQDGSYLAERLLHLGYRVWGMIRRSSTPNTSRIDHLSPDPFSPRSRLRLIYGDLTDISSLKRVLKASRPDEVYNLGAQSHVRVSFEMPDYTADVTGLGPVRLLEAMRDTGFARSRFYQASSSEMFGGSDRPLRESSPFLPRSPYAAAKLHAFHMVRLYREVHGFFAANGILFNHESERRGEAFVTRKITRSAGRILHGLQERLSLGNLNARRDWGYAPEFVDAMIRMLRVRTPSDWVVATGRSHSVREFCERAFARVGLPLRWTGSGVRERGMDRSGRTLVDIDASLYRPSEPGDMRGDPTRARKDLGWSARTSFGELVDRMTDHDADLARREAGR
jgi:GDPmannose 4,6-dehydratase